MIILVPIMIIAAIREALAGQPIADGLLSTLILGAGGAFLVWHGTRLKAQRIPVLPKPKPAAPPVTTVSATPLLDAIATRAEKGRLALYVMPELHNGPIVHLVSQDPQFVPKRTGGSGAIAAWADVIAEPTNPADPHAVQVWVNGQPIAYFALEWKDIAHAQLRVDAGRPTRVPVVVRLRDGQPHVWAHTTIEDAQSFATWLHNQDR